MCRNSAKCWKTNPTRRSCTLLAVSSTSPIRIWPSFGVSSPAIIRRTVLLPDPDGPSSAVIAPPGAVNDTSLTALNVPNRLVSCSTTIGVLMCVPSFLRCDGACASIATSKTIETAARVSATM